MYQIKPTIQQLSQERPLIQNEIKIQKDKLSKPIIFPDKEAIKHFAIIGELKATAKKPIIGKIQIDEKGFQISSSKQETGINTAYLQYKQKQIQTDFVVHEIQLNENKQLNLYMFIKENFGNIENALIENEIVNLYQNDLQNNPLKNLNQKEEQSQNSIKEIKSFDFEQLQNYRAIYMEHSKSLPLIGVTYQKNQSFLEMLTQESKQKDFYIFLWNSQELQRFTPQAILISPIQISCFSFCEQDPFMIFAGATNGQVFLFDLKGLKIQQEKLNKKKKQQGQDETQIFYPIMQSVVYDSQNIIYNSISRDIISRKPYMCGSHKNEIVSIQSVPQEQISLLKKKIVLKNSNPSPDLITKNFDAFLTSSKDGQILLWSLGFGDIKEGTELSSREINQLKTQWRAILSIQIPLSEIKIHEFYNVVFIFEPKQLYCLLTGNNGETVQTKIEYTLIQSDDQPGNNIFTSKQNQPEEHFLVDIDFNYNIQELLLLVYSNTFSIVSTQYKESPLYNSVFSLLASNLCGCFSKKRSSLIFIGKEDGLIEIWDLMESIEIFNQTFLVSASGINQILNDAFWPDLLIVADKIGGVHLLQLPQTFQGDNSQDDRFWKNQKEILKLFQIQNSLTFNLITSSDKIQAASEENIEHEIQTVSQEEEKKNMEIFFIFEQEYLQTIQKQSDS